MRVVDVEMYDSRGFFDGMVTFPNDCDGYLLSLKDLSSIEALRNFLLYRSLYMTNHIMNTIKKRTITPTMMPAFTAPSSFVAVVVVDFAVVVDVVVTIKVALFGDGALLMMALIFKISKKLSIVDLYA